ncbi:MAG: peptidase U32 family protein [Burkholderiales bacterium]
MTSPSPPTSPIARTATARPVRRPDLVCPAGSLPALKAAVDAGADCVYVGLRNETNARNFAGLNFDRKALDAGLSYAQSRGRRVLLALNTYAQPGRTKLWTDAIDAAADAGVDALILADAGLMAYASQRHPGLALHLSVQGSSTTYEAINFHVERFGVKRAVLPRVLSVAQVAGVIEKSACEIEVFGFGSLCVMVEGRCALSSYTTGEGPNLCGVCSPAKAVRWETTSAGLEARLAGVLIDRYAEGEPAGYPTICKGRYSVDGDVDYAIEEPTSLNTLPILGELVGIGVAAVKIEGRQRGPAYVAAVTRVWRQAIDECLRDPARFAARPAWLDELGALAEGRQTTLGALDRAWR